MPFSTLKLKREAYYRTRGLLTILLTIGLFTNNLKEKVVDKFSTDAYLLIQINIFDQRPLL